MWTGTLTCSFWWWGRGFSALPTVWEWCCPRATENTSSWGTHLWKKVGQRQVLTDSLEEKNGCSWDTGQGQPGAELIWQHSRSWAWEQILRAGLSGKEGSVCPKYPGCAGSASRSPKPTEPKTCQLCFVRFWEALLGQRGLTGLFLWTELNFTCQKPYRRHEKEGRKSERADL